MSVLVFDIEGDGLLDTISKIYCVVTQDIDSGEIKTYYESKEEIYEGLKALYYADCIIGHNILSFDIPAIQKFYPKWKYKNCYDTFILSCLFNPDRYSHSIESYSSGRKVAIKDWSCLTYEMLDRCVVDVIVNAEVFSLFREKVKEKCWKKAIELEQQVAINHVRQVQAGVHVDIETLHGTLGCLDAELEALSSLVYEKMPYRCIPGDQYKKVFKKNGDLMHYVDKYFGGAESIWKDYT